MHGVVLVFGKKGQAAMEYLMTYGWALLVIFIVIAVLYFLSQGFTGGERCTFSNPGLACDNPNVPLFKGGAGADVGTLKGKIVNGIGKGIYVYEIGCTADTSKNPGSSALLSTQLTAASVVTVNSAIAPQGSLDMATLNLKCTDSSGIAYTAASGLAQGTDYHGSIYVLYRNSDDPSTACTAAGNYCRVAKASLVVKAQA